MTQETHPESNVKEAVPFFAVANIEESVRYYVDGLGFKMTKKWIDEGKLRWCWLEHGNAALMLQEFRREGKDAWMPQREGGRRRDGVLHLRGRTGALSGIQITGDSGVEAVRRQWNVGDLPLRPGWLSDRVREPDGCS
jgi:catechol 2,3-dioxygenase-like lactoylglutathione lyase family enzyme